MCHSRTDRLLEAFNQTNAPVPTPVCVHELFEAQVDRTPDAVALVFRGTSLTYRELDERANRVARRTRRELGVGPDRMVGLFVERSLEMVVGLLGDPEGRRRLRADGSRHTRASASR